MTIVAEEPVRISAISAAPIHAVRWHLADLLIVKPSGSLSILAHGIREIPLRLEGSQYPSNIHLLKDSIHSSVTLCSRDGSQTRVAIKMSPQGDLTHSLLRVMSSVLPADEFFILHHLFLLQWSQVGFNGGDLATFDALRSAIYSFLYVEPGFPAESHVATASYEALRWTESAMRFLDDPALRKLSVPHPPIPAKPPRSNRRQPHEYHGLVLTGLHLVAQQWMLANLQEGLLKLVPVICRLAMVVRPEWADYWKRILPDAIGPWPSPATSGACLVSYSLSHRFRRGAGVCTRSRRRHTDTTASSSLCSVMFSLRSSDASG
jgi:anaphase-promoting complex subunit 1